MRSLPAAVSAMLVFGLLRTKRFSIVTSPASSSLARWLERLPFVSPVVRCRNTKSASATADRTVRIARRPGSWTSRSTTSSSSATVIPRPGRRTRGRGDDAHERGVSKHAVEDRRTARHHEADVARVRAVPQWDEARDEQGAPDEHVVVVQPDDRGVVDEHERRERGGDRVDRQVEGPAGPTAQQERRADHDPDAEGRRDGGPPLLTLRG